jgi:hypothetical protein
MTNQKLDRVEGAMLWRALLAAVLVVGEACGGGGGGTGGSGGGAGQTGTGGAAGGQPGGSGGAGPTGTGGATGGQPGSSGGTAGTSSGGSAGHAAAGGSGTAGQGGGGGVADGGSCTLPGTALATFDTTDEGFAYNLNAQTENLAYNVPDGGTAPTLGFSNEDGNPCKGSLKAVIPFTGYNQQVNIQKDFGTSSLQDWTGKTLHVRVKVASGFMTDSSVSPALQVHVTSYNPATDGGTDMYLYSGQYQNIQSGNGWNDYTFSVSGATYTAAGFDISKIENLGVILQTPNPPTTDGPVPAPTAAVVYVDSFYLSSQDGGT